jgi:hypothetical protein
MAPTEKADYIIDNWLSDLQQYDWWNDDTTKQEVWAEIEKTPVEQRTPTNNNWIRVEPWLLFDMIKDWKIQPWADNPEWTKYSFEDRKEAYDKWSNYLQTEWQKELSPDGWENMTTTEKAQYIYNSWLTNLKGREWWDNEQNKNDIYNLIKEFNNTTPELLAQKFSTQTNLQQDPDWIKYPLELRQQAFSLMQWKTAKQWYEEALEW